MRTAFFLLMLVAACTDEGRRLCDTTVSVVDHQQWTIASAVGSDAGQPLRRPCGPGDMSYDELAGEPSFTVSTRFCSTAAIEQPSPIALRKGEPVALRIWYFSQDRFDATEGNHLIALDGEDLWTATVPLPTTSGLLADTPLVPRDLPAGTIVRWQLSNHGANEWNLIEMSVKRRVPCDCLDGGAQ